MYAYERLNNIRQRFDGGSMFGELLIANYDLNERLNSNRQISFLTRRTIMVTFNCKITGNGNLKLSEQAQEILDLRPGDEVRVSIHLGDEEIIVPQVYLDDAGIPAGSTLEVCSENGRLIIQEAVDE